MGRPAATYFGGDLYPTAVRFDTRAYQIDYVPFWAGLRLSDWLQKWAYQSPSYFTSGVITRAGMAFALADVQGIYAEVALEKR